MAPFWSRALELWLTLPFCLSFSLGLLFLFSLGLGESPSPVLVCWGEVVVPNAARHGSPLCAASSLAGQEVEIQPFWEGLTATLGGPALVPWGSSRGFPCDLWLPGHPKWLCTALLSIPHWRSLPWSCLPASQRSRLGFWQVGCCLCQVLGALLGLRGAGRCG